MQITNKEAWHIIEETVDNEFDIDCIPEDGWILGRGLCDEKDIVHFATGGLIKDKDMCPDEIINNLDLFEILSTYGHEKYHAISDKEINNLSYYERLFLFIDNNLPNYYMFKSTMADSYYQNDLCEINAELFGLKTAFLAFSQHYGNREAFETMKKYVEHKNRIGVYFIDDDKLVNTKDIVTSFRKKRSSIFNKSYPFPSMEQVCRPIVEEYESISPGISQLELIVANVFKVRNYEQNAFIGKYGKDFWKTVFEKYPEYKSVDLENDRDLPEIDYKDENNERSKEL